MADALENMEVGMRLHAVYKEDGEFYPCTVVTISKASKRSKAPVKVHYSGQEDDYDAWVSLDNVKCKKLGLAGKGSEKAAPKGKAKAKAKAKEEPKADYSGLTKGLRIQAKADDAKYYAAEVVSVSKNKSSKAPVKVHWVGYTAASDEWVGPDQIRSKALKFETPKAKAKAKAKGKGKAKKGAPKEPLTKATCDVGPKGKPCGGGEDVGEGVYGSIRLFQRGDKCTISYEIKGLTPGKHAFHIHEKADFSDGCTSAGPHYNPFKKTHGGPGDEERHVGDLGNIEANAEGVAKGKIVDKLVKLEGEHNVIGRSFMIHQDEDDCGTGDNSEPGPPPVNGKASKATGNAGARVACGEIKIVPGPIKAVCEVSPQGKPCGGGEEAAPDCSGKIWLRQVGDKCQIRYVVKGLTPGKHGFHIHEKADFSDGCKSCGPHYNPFKKTHGNRTDEERHVGDLGNIEANAKGVARGAFVDTLIKLDGENSVIGRSIIVHEDEDDCGTGDNSEPGPPPVNGKCSKATGNAGARIACGKIDLVVAEPAAEEKKE